MMKPWIATGAAMGAAALATVAADRYVVWTLANRPGLADHDLVAAAWTTLGGAPLFAIGLFLGLAWILLATAALDDLARARARLIGVRPDWSATFAGGAFATLADLLSPREIGAAPIALARAVRGEIWRAEIRNLTAVTALAVFAFAAATLIAPATLEAPIFAAHASLLAAGLLLLALLAGLWLLTEAAIARLGRAIVNAVPSRAASETADLAAAVNALVAALAERPDPAAEWSEAAAALRADLAAAFERLDATLRTLPPARADDDRPAPLSDAVAGQLSSSLAEIARSMAALSAENVSTRWDELHAAIRAVGETIDGLARSLELDAAPTPPRTVTDELEELLEEMSEDAPRPRRLGRR